MNKTGRKLPIANSPDPSNPNDEYCSVCGDDKMWVVIKGGQNCGYCGNQINLCQKCYYRFREESVALDLDSGMTYGRQSGPNVAQTGTNPHPSRPTQEKAP